MRTVATKVDNTLPDKVIHHCNSISCSPSEYIRNLIRKDLGEQDRTSIKYAITSIGTTNTLKESSSYSNSSCVDTP